jgi:hypothetical protein
MKKKGEDEEEKSIKSIQEERIKRKGRILPFGQNLVAGGGQYLRRKILGNDTNILAQNGSKFGCWGRPIFKKGILRKDTSNSGSILLDFSQLGEANI